MKEKPELLPGDVLLYRPSDLWGWIIAVKTWNKLSHVEAYAGENKSVAARFKKGVGLYPIRWQNLAQVRRPDPTRFSPSKAMHWFYSSAVGQKYDFFGQLVFILAVKHGSRKGMWCSEFATRWLRAGGLPFLGDYDADRVAPAQFLMSELLPEVWRA